jgi:hypothetical protein
MPSWLSFCSSNLLLSLQGVQQPCEDPSVDSSFKFRTQRVLFSSVPVCTLLNAHLAEYLLQNFQQFCPPVHSMHLLNAHLAELSESSVILFLLNSQQSSSSVHSLHLLNAHLAELHRTPQSFCLQLCLSYTALPPRYSTTLRSSLSC